MIGPLSDFMPKTPPYRSPFCHDAAYQARMRVWHAQEMARLRRLGRMGWLYAIVSIVTIAGLMAFVAFA